MMTRQAENKIPSNRKFTDDVRADATSVITYEQRLSSDPRWALSDASLFFEGKGSVQEALRKIVKRLDELGIPYVVVGGLALFGHGYRRFTQDVDLLVTREGLHRIHEALEGLGYLPPYRGSKHLRDTELGVKIEFLVTGDFPGDGKPKPVSFPNPVDVKIEINGIPHVQLPKLIDLKLASGMTNTGRVKDLGDVQEMIKALGLPQDFVTRLDPFVQSKFNELWLGAQTAEGDAFP
jgi:hypothetical protein